MKNKGLILLLAGAILISGISGIVIYMDSQSGDSGLITETGRIIDFGDREAEIFSENGLIVEIDARYSIQQMGYEFLNTRNVYISLGSGQAQITCANIGLTDVEILSRLNEGQTSLYLANGTAKIYWTIRDDAYPNDIMDYIILFKHDDEWFTFWKFISDDLVPIESALEGAMKLVFDGQTDRVIVES